MIKKFDFPIGFLHEKRTIHMYLPDSYLQSNKKYPTLYMFDGHNLFIYEDATFGRAWRLQCELEQYGKECIVVGIECSHHGNQRLAEYSPYPFFEPSLGEFQGWGKQTMDFIIRELKPYIDTHYPTRSDRKNTWIGGSSCGGLMALYAGFRFSYAFSKALVISPYIQPTFDQLMQELKITAIHPQTMFYISWGVKEEKNDTFFIQETKQCTEIVNILQNKRIPTYMNVRLDGRHCEESWQEEAKDYIPFLFDIKIPE